MWSSLPTFIRRNGFVGHVTGGHGYRRRCVWDTYLVVWESRVSDGNEWTSSSRTSSVLFSSNVFVGPCCCNDLWTSNGCHVCLSSDGRSSFRNSSSWSLDGFDRRSTFSLNSWWCPSSLSISSYPRGPSVSYRSPCTWSQTSYILVSTDRSHFHTTYHSFHPKGRRGSGG